jgi:hypothetical protein
MKNWFKRLHAFMLCFLEDSCEYSIKKLLAFAFSGLAFYIAIFTEKPEVFVEILGFIAVLLGIRAWERTKIPPKNNENQG